MSLRSALLVGVACFATPTAAAAAAPAGPVALTAGGGNGVIVKVHESPFSLSFLGGARELDEVPSDGTPVRVTQLSPQPDILGDQQGYGPLSFTLGAHAIVPYTTVLWSGDDIVGANAGAIYNPVGVLDAVRDGSRWTIDVSTDAPGSPAATLELAFRARGQVEVSFTSPQDLPVSAVGDAFGIARGERFFGFGGRHDAVDQRGLYRTDWPEEENFVAPEHQYWTDNVPYMGPEYTFPNGPGSSYHPESSFISSRGYGVLVNGSAPSSYDVGASTPAVDRFQVLGPTLDYTLQFGSPQQVIAGLTAITGRNPVPPAYALEPQIDGLVTAANITSAAAMESDANTMASTVRHDGLPVKVLGIEMWSSIPPAASAALAAKLRRGGFVPYAYFWPFVTPGSQQYTDAARLGLLIKNAAGQPYVYSGEGAEPVAMWDFTNPATVTYWQHDMVGEALDQGYGGFMLDFGEEILPGMHFHSGAGWFTEHNAYPVQYAHEVRLAVQRWQAAHGGAAAHPVFFYTRSGYTGEQRWSGGVFPGDEATDWSVANGIGSLIPLMVNLSVVGNSMWSTDVGGYSTHDGSATPELYDRWVELGALSPMMRVHSSESGQTWPWTEGGQTLAIYRTYAELHHNLVGYLLRAARATARTGVGIARPLWLEDLSAPESALSSEYLLGDDLLVAPVLTPGARSVRVYLPRGADWKPMKVTVRGHLKVTGAARRGGSSLDVPVGLADTPVFLRAGARNPAP